MSIRRVPQSIGGLFLCVLLASAWLYRQRGSNALVGLWEVGAPRALSDPLRFYYFHDGGKGLYRYGQVGYNQTSSFDWRVSGEVVTLRFRKTGDVVKTRFTIDTRDGQSELVLADDPRNDPGTRYRKRAAALDAEGPLELAAAEPAGADMERMWIDRRTFATGGSGFRMYQLSKHDAGSGATRLGWFHAGDFDDWTTETLVYRQQPSALSLRFLLRGEVVTTPMTLEPRRALTLTNDPRNFGARSRFADSGASF